jgi:mono/diheme cytochrome c family protein
MKTKIILAGLIVLATAATQAGDSAPATAPSAKHANLMGSTRFTETDGGKLYATVCASCHMQNAMGGTGAGFYPALAKNEKLATASYPVMMVMNGRGPMPSFREAMTDAQIAAVVGYVRTHFGNNYADPVSLDDVKQVREAK